MNTEEIINALNDIMAFVDRWFYNACRSRDTGDYEDGLERATDDLGAVVFLVENLIGEIKDKELSAKIHSK